MECFKILRTVSATLERRFQLDPYKVLQVLHKRKNLTISNTNNKRYLKTEKATGKSICCDRMIDSSSMATKVGMTASKKLTREF